MTAGPELLRCARCGCKGRAPTIIWNRGAPPHYPRPVLRLAFGWGDPPITVLLCDACRGRLAKRRKRGRAPR